MVDLEWFVKMFPQGTAVTAAISVMALILLKYVPTLVQSLITSFEKLIKEERELFRAELKELRTTYTDGLKEVTTAFTARDEVLSDRIDGLSHEVKGLKERLEH